MGFSSSSLPNSSSFSLEKAVKQFSLESERVEQSYQKLNSRFLSVQQLIQNSHAKMAGKISELNFISHYLGTILDHMSQGILFLDSNGFVTTYNAAAFHLLKIPISDLLYHRLTDFFDDKFFGFSLKDIFRSSIAPLPKLISLKQPGGESLIEIETTFVSMEKVSSTQDPSGRVSQGLLILMRDVTKLHRLQESMHHNQRLKELGELAAHFAHEIRNPLGGIKGFASLLKQDLAEFPPLQQMVNYILQGVDDVNFFVSQILNYVRPFQAELVVQDLIPLVHEVVNLLQADSTWNSKIHVSIHHTLKQIAIPLDRPLFKSALLNLCVNACQSMAKGGELTLTIEMQQSTLHLSIKDSGCGIPQENLAKIFSLFFTTKEKGTGLGLAEVQKVIHAHYGWIEVFSILDKGSEFIIKIPLKMEG